MHLVAPRWACSASLTAVVVMVSGWTPETSTTSWREAELQAFEAAVKDQGGLA